MRALLRLILLFGVTSLVVPVVAFATPPTTDAIVFDDTFVYAPGSDPASKPVGTGPFTFVEYRPKEFITVQRNPNY